MILWPTKYYDCSLFESLEQNGQRNALDSVKFSKSYSNTMSRNL